MIEYGYINNDGYLVSRIIEEYVQKFENENQSINEEIITIEMQINDLKKEGWKPVDTVDDSKLNAKNEFSSIRIQPYDGGEQIGYKYIESIDKKLISNKIGVLKTQLESSDFKVIKCYEASLIGEPSPYDIEKLRTIRQLFRDKINELEAMLNN